MTSRYRGTIVPTGECLIVDADTIERAAARLIRRLYGRTATAQRLTGTTGQSGLFAAYQYDRRLQASNRVGSDLHIARHP